MPAIAQVEPLTTARALRGPFDYRLPDRLRAGVAIGSMLVIPFGRREVLGVVVGLSDRSELADDRLLAPLRALELGVPADLVSLAEWIAHSYCSTPARSLSLVLPPGTARGARSLTRLVAELTPSGRDAMSPAPPGDAPRLTTTQRHALESLREGPLPATATGAAHATLRRLATRGLVSVEPRRMPRRPQHLPWGRGVATRPRSPLIRKGRSRRSPRP